jgi:hypothetical protein
MIEKRDVMKVSIFGTKYLIRGRKNLQASFRPCSCLVCSDSCQNSVDSGPIARCCE